MASWRTPQSTMLPCYDALEAIRGGSVGLQNQVRDLTMGGAGSGMDGRVAVITGGGRGIGAAIGSKLASLGAVAVLCGRSRAPLESTVAAIKTAGGQAEALECDVTDLRSVEALAAHIDRKFGKTDILVNNAGIGGFGGPLQQMAPEAWDEVLNTNLRGVFYCIRAIAPMMIK